MSPHRLQDAAIAPRLSRPLTRPPMFERRRASSARTRLVLLAVGLLMLAGVPGDAWARGIAAADKRYIQCTFGVRLMPFG